MVVILRPSVRTCCSEMFSLFSSAITWRLIRPLGPGVSTAAAGCG
ncbi:Uncharacterised protein [Mycobacteroides abscessus subsp. abscessus]|nr:Uncharacterised protein [Mycobacteroides abscessus subsp. abscessus]